MDPGEKALADLLEKAHRMHPDDLGDEVRAAGRAMGVEDVVVYIVDRDQRQLTPLADSGLVGDGAGGPGEGPEPVDGSMAGRCYQRGEQITVEVAPDGSHTYYPLLDGTARLGVMRARVDPADGPALAWGAHLASLASYLVVAKTTVGDRLARAFNVKQLSLAAEMRWAALPPLAFDNHRVALGAMLQPAYEIAGDTFDYAVEGDVLHLGIFDAMGHGLRASILANTAVYAYRLGRREGMSLEDLYRSIDDAIATEFGDEPFVTAQLVTIDLDRGTLRSVCAGHPRALLLRNRTSIHELEADVQLPLGMGHRDVEVTEQRLEPGDTVVYYSDGISEARSGAGEEFGVERLKDFLVRAASSDLTPSEVARRALHAVAEHHSGTMADDATLVLLTWSGPGSDRGLSG